MPDDTLPATPPPDDRCPMCGRSLAGMVDRCPHCGESLSPSRPPATRFRWRIIPTAFLSIFGGLMTVAGVYQAVASLVLSAQFAERPADERPFAASPLSGILTFISGSLWMLAAALWWRGRWRWALAIAIVGYLPGVAARLIQ
jgi:hypothetical protein